MGHVGVVGEGGLLNPGASLPLGGRKILVERCPIAQKEALLLLRLALDVAPVSLTAEGMVP